MLILCRIPGSIALLADVRSLSVRVRMGNLCLCLCHRLRLHLSLHTRSVLCGKHRRRVRRVPWLLGNELLSWLLNYYLLWLL